MSGCRTGCYFLETSRIAQSHVYTLLYRYSEYSSWMGVIVNERDSPVIFLERAHANVLLRRYLFFREEQDFLWQDWELSPILEFPSSLLVVAIPGKNYLPFSQVPGPFLQVVYYQLLWNIQVFLSVPNPFNEKCSMTTHIVWRERHLPLWFATNLHHPDAVSRACTWYAPPQIRTVNKL